MSIKSISVREDIHCWMGDNDVVLSEQAYKQLVKLLSFYYGKHFAHFIVLGKDRIVQCDSEEPGAIEVFSRGEK